MTRSISIRRPFAMAGILVMLAACIHAASQFDRYLAQQQWTDAAREFANDPSLSNDESSLYNAAVLFGTPGRPTYDPQRARDLFAMLLSRFPGTRHRDDATARLALIDEALNARQGAAARERELQSRIAELTRQTRELHARIDSLSTQGDSLRVNVSRLEADRRDRDEQLRTLRAELQKLKEIDLKQRPPARIRP